MKKSDSEKVLSDSEKVSQNSEKRCEKMTEEQKNFINGIHFPILLERLRKAYLAMLTAGEYVSAHAPMSEIVRILAQECDKIEKQYPCIKNTDTSTTATTLWCISDSLRAEEHIDTCARPQDME